MTRKTADPAPRGRPRDQRVDDAILDAALELFGQGGLDAATFEGVASRAGVSRSAVYRRWTDRESLIGAALAHRRTLGEHGAEHWHTSGSVAVAMKLFTDSAVDVLTDPASLRLLGHVAALDPKSLIKQAYWSAIVAPRREVFAAMIDSARERGELPSGAPADVVQDLLAGALMYRALMHPRPLSRRAARRYVTDVVKAVGLGTS